MKRIYLMVFTVIFFQGCSGDPLFHQPGSDLEQVYSKVFITDYNTAWQAALDALKRYDKSVQNRQGGVIQTAWIDNTSDQNFMDTFGGESIYIKSKYRMSVTLSPMKLRDKETVKVSILKEQQIQRDPLEGWKKIKSDAITENSILYRMGRIILIKLKLKQIEDEKLKEVMEKGI